MYRVLVPMYKPAGFDRDGEQLFSVRWKEIGVADSMQSAKKFTPYPVLEEVK